MKHRVKIKTVEQMEKMNGVTFQDIPENMGLNYRWWASYGTITETSYDTFPEDFDDDLPEDRIVEIIPDGETYVAPLNGCYYRVDDWMIDDNFTLPEDM